MVTSPRTASWAAALILATGYAFAADAEVSTERIAQSQEGELNVLDTQVGRVEDARSESRADVEALQQAQSGEANVMQLHVGNALAGGHSDASARRLQQTQRGDGGTQQMMIGNAAGEDGILRYSPFAGVTIRYRQFSVT